MVLQAAIEGLNSTIGKAIGRIENAIAISDQAQKASLSLGQSLEGANRVLDGSIKGLRGDFGTRLQAGLTALNAGFQGNIKSIGKLINQQQLTGGQFKETARSLSKLEVVLNLSRNETSQLADTILDTNKTFAVSTDKLVAALGALEQNMSVLETAGLGGVVPQALVQLAGQMGPQVEKQLASVMGFLFDPSMDTQAKLAALGLGNLRERLAAGASPVDTLLDAFDTAANAVNRLAGDTSKFYAGFSVPLELLGPVAKDFVALQTAMNRRDRTALANQGQFFDQINVLMSEILAPLDELFSAEFYPVVKGFVNVLSEMTKPIVQSGIDKLKGFLSEGPDQLLLNVAKTIDPILAFLIKSLNTVSQALAAFAKFTMKTMGVFVTTGILNPTDVYGELGTEYEKAIKKEEELVAKRKKIYEGEGEFVRIFEGKAFSRGQGGRFQVPGKPGHVYGPIGINDPLVFSISENIAREAGELTNDILVSAAMRARRFKDSIPAGFSEATTLKEMGVGLTKAERKKELALYDDLISEQKDRTNVFKTKMQREVDRVANFAAPQVGMPKKTVEQYTMEYLARTAAATEATADHTDPELGKGKPTEIMDASIRSLGETLLSITRQAVEGPDEYKETVAGSLAVIASNTEIRFDRGSAVGPMMR